MIEEKYMQEAIALAKKGMQEAIALAKKGTGRVSPNPLVGAVIVKDGEVIGRGYHEKYGQPHAERNALSSCSVSPEGADMYVTLEPCCHHGKQPPCTEAIVAAGIKRVIIGSSDPNPLVSGKGVVFLKEHGIEVEEGFMKEECDALNDIFFHYIKTGRPFVTMKYAMTMDGKIAAFTGKSKWITGEEARKHVHGERNRNTAIMVGVGTVIADDPMLTCRIEGGRNPVRIICDSRLRTPIAASLVLSTDEAPVIIATCSDDKKKAAEYIEKGCRILKVKEKDGRIDLDDLMKKLGEEKIDSILLEGGGTLNWEALKSGIVNRVQAYIAPKLLGGKDAKTPVEGKGAPSPQEAVMLGESRITKLGDDLLIESEVISDVHGNS